MVEEFYSERGGYVNDNFIHSKKYFHVLPMYIYVNFQILK